ncbi:unnamed protein product, partial [Laminaria digitata]
SLGVKVAGKVEGPPREKEGPATPAVVPAEDEVPFCPLTEDHNASATLAPTAQGRVVGIAPGHSPPQPSSSRLSAFPCPTPTSSARATVRDPSPTSRVDGTAFPKSVALSDIVCLKALRIMPAWRVDAAVS